MLGDDDIRRLRALVNAEPIATPPDTRRSIPWRTILHWFGIALASSIVLASIAGAGWLVLTELSKEDPAVDVSTATARPDASPEDAVTAQSDDSEPATIPLPTAVNSTGDPFEELRYLPTGSVTGMALQTVVRGPNATPIAAFVRIERGDKLTGAVFVDRSTDTLIDGVGVTARENLDVAGQIGETVGAGPLLSHLVSWQHPSLGPLRAWAMGVRATEVEEIVSAVASRLDDPDTSLPDGWSGIDAYGADGARATWRSMYLAASGEILVVSTSATSSETSTAVEPGACVERNNGACSYLDVSIDSDGIEVILFASTDRVDLVSRQLRPVAASNARIRSTEVEPGAELPAASARRLLYLPDDDRWSVVDTLVHSSGQSVSAPSLVLLERDAPEIGRITSAVVVRHLPEGEANTETSPQLFDDAEAVATVEDDVREEADTAADDSQPAEEATAGALERFVVEKSGVTLEIASSGHFQLELALVDRLLSVDDSGLRFASRALSSVGLERNYEDVLLDPFPVIEAEGTVFGALIRNEAGVETTVRVSSVPRYVPEAVAVLPHSNDRITQRIRGATASLVVLGNTATLAWEEQPGLLISLSGNDEAELVRVAEALELVRPEEITAT